MKHRKLFLIAGLAMAMTAAPASSAFAADIETVESEVASAQEDLDSLRSSIDDLETQKEELTGEIDELEAKLVATISGIKSIDAQIADMIAQMEVTAKELVSAQEDRDIQYAAMKKRIQYLYETGGEAGWAAMFLAGGNLSDILDKAEYTQQMYDYDRKQLEEYLGSIRLVEELQERQRSEKSALETRKHEQEEAKKRLEELIAQAEKEFDDYETKISEAYAKADEYQALIEAQNQVIAELVAAQQAMGVGAEEATVVAQQIVESYYQDNGGSAGSTSVAAAVSYANASGSGSGGSSSGEVYSSSGLGGAGVGTTRYSGSSQIAQSSNTSANGAAILAYAQQFLGNSYVYGGNSLTNGVDCSGFVQQVYKNFGINTSRTSWDIESDGEAVSYNDVQVGDVVCYGGHVGIYAGDNQIINAIDEAHGIGYSDVNYAEIRSIRRFVDEDSVDSSYAESYDEGGSGEYGEGGSDEDE